MINIDDRFITEKMPIIGAKATAVLLAISKHLGKDKTAFPSKYTLQKYTGLGRDAVTNGIKKLVENGIIDKEQRKNPINKMMCSNEYEVKTPYINVYITESPSTANPCTEKTPLSINKELSINKYKEEVFILKKEIEKLKAELDKHKPNELEYKNEIIEIVNFLNEKTGKSFKAKTIATSTLIRARLKDYTVEDFKKVITNKVLEWSGTEFERYLQPSTLFNVNKFENYMNQKSTETVKIEKDDFVLDANYVDKYTEIIENGRYPALRASKTKYICKKEFQDLQKYREGQGYFVESGFNRLIVKCLKELNTQGFTRNSYLSAYDYIREKAREEINNN